jgi:hypothetical protein
VLVVCKKVSRRDGSATFKQKDRPKRSLCSSDRAGDQATRSAGPFCFRRYAIKPMPKKPWIIIAQVEGSGTAVVNANSKAVGPVEKPTLSKRPNVVKSKLIGYPPGFGCWRRRSSRQDPGCHRADRTRSIIERDPYYRHSANPRQCSRHCPTG